MKKLIAAAIALALMTGCSPYNELERPSHVKEITLEDGTVIQEYVVGYSIEDFYLQWHGYAPR